MTKTPASPTPDAPKKDPGTDDSTQPATLVAGGPESEGKDRDETEHDAPDDAPQADAPTPETHPKGVQPLSGTTD
jgi:hypothetical protein